MSTRAQIALAIVMAAVGAAASLLDKAGVEVPPVIIFAGGLILFAAAGWSLYVLVGLRSRAFGIICAAVVIAGGGVWWSARAAYVGVGRPTSNDLVKRADALVPELRTFITRASDDRTVLDAAHAATFLSAPQLQREAVRGKHQLESGNLAQRHANEYAERFKAEARSVRVGFLDRLPTAYRDSSLGLIFENPATLESVRKIADEIERLKAAQTTARR